MPRQVRARPQVRRGAADEFVVGVMRMEVEGRDSDRFLVQVDAATVALDRAVTAALGVRVELLSVEGPQLTPAAGAYAPLDFLQIGLTEKLERGIHFLLIVTEVDLSASTLSYTLAVPSQLTNVAVVPTKRLEPAFWGDDHDDELAVRRLTVLLIHTLGHLLNLPHEEGSAKVMHDFAGVDDPAAMEQLTDGQSIQMKRTLPREAHARTSRGPHVGFVIRTLAVDLVALQLKLAGGDPLADLDQSSIVPRGHAVECRIYAENPAKMFLPSPGKLNRLTLPAASMQVRIDTGVREGDTITAYYDPMIAKLICHGPDRDAALDAMQAALAASAIDGIVHNIEFLGRVVRHAAFRGGEVFTGFIENYKTDLIG